MESAEPSSNTLTTARTAGFIAAASLCAFVQGGILYGAALGDFYIQQLAAAGLTARDEAWRYGAELARCVVLALVLWRALLWAHIASWGEAVALGALLWMGFQATTLAGSVLHESYPWALYALHAGDALVKTVLVASILSFALPSRSQKP